MGDLRGPPKSSEKNSFRGFAIDYLSHIIMLSHAGGAEARTHARTIDAQDASLGALRCHLLPQRVHLLQDKFDLPAAENSPIPQIDQVHRHAPAEPHIFN